MAIVMVIFLIVMISMIVMVVSSHLQSQARSSIRQGARTSSLDAAGAGVQAMQQALVAGRNADAVGARQADGFSIDASSLLLAAQRSGGTLVSNSSLPYRDVDTALGGQTSTIRGPVDEDGTRQYWQVVQSIPPSGEAPWMTLYLRGWREVNGHASEASVVRARLKPSSMADYQLLSDVPISIDPGARITGRVHSNGGTDEWSQPPISDSALRVWSTGSVTCQSTTGIKPVVSTARGTIDLPGVSGCDIMEGTGEYVPLDAARDTVMRVRTRRSAGASDVTTFTGSSPVTTPATALIGATSVRVTYPGGGSSTVPTPAGQPRTILFDRDVEVRSSAPTQARLTIATWSGSAAGRAAPSIIIVGNILRATPTNTQPRAIGLLAEGDVVLDPSMGSYPSTIQAAILSTTGGVRLPWRYRTPIRITSPAGFYPPQRPSLSIVGSIASHSSVATRWSWGASWIGWQSRNYAWDPWLAIYPPPYWPSTNPWEIVDQGEANADCYGARAVASMRGTTACR